MAIADTITSMQTHTSNAYTMIGYGTDLTGINKNLANLSTSIFNAFLEALRTPDTLFTNLPKKSGTGANITLNDTANAPMRITLSATELSQDGTPTPDSPQTIHTISGSNTIEVRGKNLFNKATITSGKLIQTDGNEVANASYGCSDYIQVLANQNYVRTKNNNYYGAFYDKNKQFVSAVQNNNVITPSVDGYVRVSFLLTDLDLVQLEKGSTPSPYTPYTLETAEVKLKSNNLLPNGATNKTISGVTFKVSDDGTITCSGTATANISYTISDKLKLDTGTYTLSGCPAGGSLSSYYLSIVLMGSFTFYADTGNGHTKTYDSFSYDNTNCTYRIYIANGTNTNGLIFKPMFNKGTTALPYDKYYDYGECGSIGNYENIPIRTSGKNVFNYNKFKEDYSTRTSGTPNNFYFASNGSECKYNNFKSNTTYHISGSWTSTKSNGQVKIVYTDSTELIIFADYSSSASASGTFSVSTDGTKTIDYIRFITWSDANYTLKDFQIEVGSTATLYEPYGNGTWYLKKNIGKVVLDGTNVSTYVSTVDTQYGHQVAQLLKSTLGWQSSWTTNIMLLNKYHEITSTSSVDNGTFATNFAQAFLYIFDDNFTDLATARTELVGTIIYFPLLTPTYTQITGTLAEQLENVYQKMQSQKGQTNISQVNDDLSFNLSVSAIENLD